MFVDRDIDQVMHRTRNRPLVTGAVTPRAALVFAISLEVVAFVELWLAVNLLSAVLAVSATAFYVFVYTLWLKRRSSQNIVIGGAAGAVPVLVGWSAVTGSLSWTPVVLFAIIFIWTPPHFWALAVKYRDDYDAAHVPMLPAVATLRPDGPRDPALHGPARRGHALLRRHRGHGPALRRRRRGPRRGVPADGRAALAAGEARTGRPAVTRCGCSATRSRT